VQTTKAGVDPEGIRDCEGDNMDRMKSKGGSHVKEQTEDNQWVTIPGWIKSGGVTILQ
jgi:hypothetical protein